MSQFGFCEALQTFISTDNNEIVRALRAFLPDADDSQVRAWRDSISILKRATEKLSQAAPEITAAGSIIFEYTIPLESRRIDVVLLLNGGILVLEFKGKPDALQADIDQASGYARDLRAYHGECASCDVQAVVIPTRFAGPMYRDGETDIVPPDALAGYIQAWVALEQPVPDAKRFVALEPGSVSAPA